MVFLSWHWCKKNRIPEPVVEICLFSEGLCFDSWLSTQHGFLVRKNRDLSTDIKWRKEVRKVLHFLPGGAYSIVNFYLLTVMSNLWKTITFNFLHGIGCVVIPYWNDTPEKWISNNRSFTQWLLIFKDMQGWKAQLTRRTKWLRFERGRLKINQCFFSKETARLKNFIISNWFLKNCALSKR